MGERAENQPRVVHGAGVLAPRCGPTPRRDGAELLAQACQALGADRFEQVFAAGARLSQREAVAVVRNKRAGIRAS